jgi:hypothetical protein
MDRTELLRRAADLIWDHAESGCATDPRPMAAALAAARKAGISIEEIAAYNRTRRPLTN